MEELFSRKKEASLAKNRKVLQSPLIDLPLLSRLRPIEAPTQTFSQHGEVLGPAAYVVARIDISLYLSFLGFHHFLPPIGACGFLTRPEESDLARIETGCIICNLPVINV